jgi:hypothetical protein
VPSGESSLWMTTTFNASAMQDGSVSDAIELKIPCRKSVTRDLYDLFVFAFLCLNLIVTACRLQQALPDSRYIG